MDVKDLAQLVLDAVAHGSLSWVALLPVVVLVGIVAALKYLLAPKVPFFSTPEGGLVLNVLSSGLATAVVALVGGTPFTWALLGTSLVLSWKAAGGWALLKRFLPLLLKLPFLAALFPPRSAVVSPPATAPLPSPAPTSDSIVNTP